jgi:probable O-glycosylation ligase (exosortase A-associated)
VRDLVVTAIVFGILPFVFSRPYIGIYLWTWLGFMNPHRQCWGFAFNFPFAQIVAITILIALLSSKEPKRIPWTRETVLLLIFILWMLFTTFFAFHSEAAWQQWDKVWKVMLMIYVTLMLINTRQKLEWLVWVIALSLGYYGVKGGIFTIAHGGVYNVQGPAGSFFGGRAETGVALIMIIPLMRYLQLQAQKAWIHFGLIVSMLLTGIAAIGTNSRGAFLGMGCMGAFLWLKSRNKLFTLLAILAVVAAVAVIMPPEYYERLATIKTYEQDESASGRVNAWWTGFNIAKDRIITGGGFEAFQWDTFQIYAPNPGDVHDVHSIYFQVIGEHGFIGFAMFILLAWFTWNTGNRIRRQAKQTQETKWAFDMASMVQVSMIGYASAGAFLGLAYFDFYYTLIAIVVLCNLILQEEIADRSTMATPLQPARITAGTRDSDPVPARPRTQRLTDYANQHAEKIR